MDLQNYLIFNKSLSYIFLIHVSNSRTIQGKFHEVVKYINFYSNMELLQPCVIMCNKRGVSVFKINDWGPSINDVSSKIFRFYFTPPPPLLSFLVEICLKCESPLKQNVTNSHQLLPLTEGISCLLQAQFARKYTQCSFT